MTANHKKLEYIYVIIGTNKKETRPRQNIVNKMLILVLMDFRCILNATLCQNNHNKILF